MAFCITFGTHGKYHYFDAVYPYKATNTSGDLFLELVARVFTLVDSSTPTSPIYLGILIEVTEFTGMLEGYEQVRAYCYNCEQSLRIFLIIRS